MTDHATTEPRGASPPQADTALLLTFADVICPTLRDALIPYGATQSGWDDAAAHLRAIASRLAQLTADAAGRDAWRRVAAMWMIQAYSRGYGVSTELMRWADETLGDWPFGEEPAAATRAAIAASPGER